MRSVDERFTKVASINNIATFGSNDEDYRLKSAGRINTMAEAHDKPFTKAAIAVKKQLTGQSRVATDDGWAEAKSACCSNM